VLSVNGVQNIDMLALVIAGGENIQSFDISCTAISRMILMDLVTWMYRMQSLNISYADQIDDSCITQISEKCHNLRSLNLKGLERITDTSICRLAEGCPNLLSLELGLSNKISDCGVIKIAKSCLELQFLGLESLVEISDTSILKMAECCKNICRIDVNGCNKIIVESIESVADHCPNIRNLGILVSPLVTTACSDKPKKLNYWNIPDYDWGVYHYITKYSRFNLDPYADGRHP
jgi:hypothetical protein